MKFIDLFFYFFIQDEDQRADEDRREDEDQRVDEDKREGTIFT